MNTSSIKVALSELEADDDVVRITHAHKHKCKHAMYIVHAFVTPGVFDMSTNITAIHSVLQKLTHALLHERISRILENLVSTDRNYIFRGTRTGKI